ncbi:uncharacterized protein GGS25DRAFT_508290 [Hypoxylon fragiforme]|uniref:uncharacterized protein n=1 Tax=Hypoxylon fragiforme TaxID=63214 RepID=UPI0020C63DDD|nr:uncharacterized protein GGS25DRAFT_508290 [Hypoxylon fragiforme]KAI2604451.1 hypothetical protein GGS25DRAFT_508290 [Hypoxylon fragiforme]
MTTFTIPSSHLDLRPSSEIFSGLRSFRPVTSEKNIWAFWDKGLDAMYPSYLHTAINWVRKHSSSSPRPPGPSASSTFPPAHQTTSSASSGRSGSRRAS